MTSPTVTPNPPPPPPNAGEDLGTSSDGCCPNCGDELVWNNNWLKEHVDAPGRLANLEEGDDGNATQVVSFWDRCKYCGAVLHVVARITVMFDIHASVPEKDDRF